MHRFHVPDLPHEGALAALSDEESRHLTQVLRLATGDDVLVFDGRGRQHAARVEIVARRRAEVRIGSPVAAAAEPATRLTLAAALLKADSFDHVVRDATMMGVAAIQPLITDRTEVPAARSGRVARVDRWRRLALSAVKQCGRASLPEIREPQALAAVLESLPLPLITLAEPSLAAGRSALPSAPLEATVLVGPEGGWSPAERDRLVAAAATFLQLGERTLRADAAPLVAMAALLWHWDAF